MTALSSQVKTPTVPSYANIVSTEDNCSSPARKLPRTSSSSLITNPNATNNTALPDKGESSHKLSPVVLKLSNENPDSNTVALKHLDADDLLSLKFTTKMSRDGSINLLCKSFSDALAIKENLQSKLDLCDIAPPSLRNAKKIDLVGVPYKVTVAEALTSLVKNNPDLGLVVCEKEPNVVYCKSNLNCRLSVLQIERCHSGRSYRIRANVSSDLYKWLEYGTLKICNALLHWYDVSSHNGMCYKCKDFGHSASDCKSKVDICGKCSGSHRTDECKSDNLSCINCKRHNFSDTNHAVFSSTCPVLIKHRHADK